MQALFWFLVAVLPVIFILVILVIGFRRERRKSKPDNGP